VSLVGLRASDTSTPARRRVLWEILGLWLVTLLLIRAVVGVQSFFSLHEAVLAAVPCLFIYAPVILCHIRRVDSYAYGLSVPAFGDGASWRAALSSSMRLLGIILVPWLVLYHFYQTRLFGFAPAWRIPTEAWTLVAYHVFFVAIPEEFFYRGYLQTRLNEVFERPFLLFGVPFGHSLWLSSLFFAFGHSVVSFQWWHFAIFFPSLLFGLLREKTGGVLAGAFFHAACNVLVVFLDTAYGVRPI
jgi:membrane protease YdiL (CAAX protease family)